MPREVSDETRAKLSRALRGKRNAAGKHRMSPEGAAANAAAQRQRWNRWREEQASGG